ncbi:hypothetical protein J7T55_015430 [Diaporthe amygdali]|uniref:uncharacterized protein n=1 Tax=Phomopsis amygdali TaxID=1214568 RepID=UPI0022FE952D|nr:uncharacterized protein J7T55_015430 [Diaporthe amygdali]KAJ0120698.1 hypothetical protein J7T55_015430 [Diaporthe amygdali]
MLISGKSHNFSITSGLGTLFSPDTIFIVYPDVQSTLGNVNYDNLATGFWGPFPGSIRQLSLGSRPQAIVITIAVLISTINLLLAVIRSMYSDITATTSTTFISTTSALQCPLDYSNDEHSSSSNGPHRLDPDDTTTTTTTSKPPPSVTALGLSPSQCVLQMDSARTSITWPWTPGGGLVLRNDLDAAGVTTFTEAAKTNYMQGTRTSLLRWLSSTTNAVNCGPSIVSFSGLEYQAALDAAPDDTSEEHQRKQQAMPSIDHVFEKNWLLMFFWNIIDPNAPPLSSVPSQFHVIRQINCIDLHNFFFGVHRSRNTMGELFNAMPGGDANFLSLAVSNPTDFTLRCNTILAAKWRIRPTDDFDGGYRKFQECITWVQDIWLGFEALNRPDMDNILTETLWQVWDVFNRKIMEQVARDENFGADKFPIAQRFTEYMKTLQSNINTESNNRVPQLFNTLQTDLNILRPLALHPDQVGLYNGVETKLNFFRSFAMNSGKWTWDSDLGMNTYHTPPSPPSPASPTSECGELSGISTCSAAAATDSTKMTSMSATEVTHSQPTPVLHVWKLEWDCTLTGNVNAPYRWTPIVHYLQVNHQGRALDSITAVNSIIAVDSIVAVSSIIAVDSITAVNSIIAVSSITPFNCIGVGAGATAAFRSVDTLRPCCRYYGSTDSSRSFWMRHLGRYLHYLRDLFVILS